MCTANRPATSLCWRLQTLLLLRSTRQYDAGTNVERKGLQVPSVVNPTHAVADQQSYYHHYNSSYFCQLTLNL